MKAIVTCITPLRIEEIKIELRSIQEGIMDSTRHALDLVRELKGRNGIALDERTWAANIEMAVLNDTQWLGSNMHTLQDVIDELDEKQHDDDDDEADKDEEDEDEKEDQEDDDDGDKEVANKKKLKK